MVSRQAMAIVGDAYSIGVPTAFQRPPVISAPLPVMSSEVYDGVSVAIRQIATVLKRKRPTAFGKGAWTLLRVRLKYPGGLRASCRQALQQAAPSIRLTTWLG